MNKQIAACVCSLLLLAGCKSCNNNVPAYIPPPAIPVINYAVVKYFPHDTTSFTEGLLVHNGRLWEATGHAPKNEWPQTRSLFGVVDMGTGKIAVKAEIDKNKYFGEGISFFGNRLYQLTLSPKVGFVYDTLGYRQLSEFTFPGNEGWGLTTDSSNLIMSDGTGTLYYLNPATLQQVKTLTVSHNGVAADSLNELEYINGYIYANVWLTNAIIKIDPRTGDVAGKLDLTTLAEEAKNKYPGSLEMNGIAWDAATDKIYITGKLWPTIYQVAFAH
ncbi:MAG TPA: glutaminyl-peptide cyclotransferase [Chitinophagaceae bacterium]|nr:glutaminyl-peptide cyclotransferase [Chitinophagaceae bacterium]